MQMSTASETDDRLYPTSDNTMSPSEYDATSATTHRVVAFRVKVALLFFAFNFFYGGIEVGYAGLVMTYVVTYLDWSKDDGSVREGMTCVRCACVGVSVCLSEARTTAQRSCFCCKRPTLLSQPSVSVCPDTSSRRYHPDMVVGWVHPWVRSEIFMVEIGWVGFSYQNLYIIRYYQTDISLFTSDCSHLVFLAALYSMEFRPLYQIMLLMMMMVMMIMTKLVICTFLHFRIFSCIMLMFAVGLGWVIENGHTTMSGITSLSTATLTAARCQRQLIQYFFALQRCRQR